MSDDRGKVPHPHPEGRAEDPERPHNPFNDAPEVPLDAPNYDPVEGPVEEEEED